MLEALNDNVIVERAEAVRKTPGGILLPDTAQRKPTRGKVVSAGPGKLNDVGGIIPGAVAVGDVVLFGEWNGSPLEHDGKEYHVVREGEILARLVDGPKAAKK